MGLNTLGQLGIGKTFNQALQPMLVRCLDNKSITQLAVGQHHCACVADGKLYTWGELLFTYFVERFLINLLL